MSDFQQSGKLYPMFLPILLFLVLAGLVPPLAAQSAPARRAHYGRGR
jgi:hypothetical protein